MGKNIFKRLASLSIFAFVFTNVSLAQDGFQRFYPTEDRTLITVGCIPSGGGDFHMLSVGIDDNQNIDKVQLSRNNPKGNLIWTREYTIIDATLITNLKSVDFVKLENDTLIIAGIKQVLGVGLDDEKFILKVDPNNGEALWSGVSRDNVDQLGPITLPLVLDGYDDSFVVYNTHGSITGDTFAIQRIQYNSSNEIVNQQAYYPEGLSGINALAGLVDVVPSVDSSTIISYVPEINGISSGLLTIDRNGDMLNSVLYSISPDSIMNYQMQTSAIAATRDTGILMTGIVFQPLTNALSNYLIKTDSIGVVEWSKFIDGNLSGLISQVNDVIERTNGEIVVSGKYFNTADLMVGDFMIYFDAEGNVVRQLDYQSDNSFFFLNSPQGLVQFTQGEMGNASDGGVLYATTGFDQGAAMVSPYIIKTDLLGGAMCNDTLDIDMVTDFEFVRDTLLMGMDDYAVTDTLLLRDRDYTGFTVPVLTLIDTVYCPQDPIMQTIDATLQGATAYEWSTGETTPSIFVTEEGEFSVTVTIGDQICYMQCDTSTITQLAFPEASIEGVLNGICEFEGAELFASSTTNFVSAIWNTGETTRSIIVSEPGNYSVTITDNCENTASANVTINEIENIPPVPSIELIDATCDFMLTVDPGLQGSAIGTTPQYSWSTGESSAIISVTDAGTYTVTVTDICDNIATAEFTIENTNALQFANLFFPQGEVENNRTFGAVIKCPDTFIGENYVLQIFNRFGNKVFETDQIEGKWNGNFSGSQAPRAVYMYQYSYDVPGGETQSGSGSITLMR